MTPRQWRSYEHMKKLKWPLRLIAKELRISLSQLSKNIKEKNVYASRIAVIKHLVALDFTEPEAEAAVSRYADVFEDGLSEQATAQEICEQHRKDMAR